MRFNKDYLFLAIILVSFVFITTNLIPNYDLSSYIIGVIAMFIWDAGLLVIKERRPH